MNVQLVSVTRPSTKGFNEMIWDSPRGCWGGCTDTEAVTRKTTRNTSRGENGTDRGSQPVTAERSAICVEKKWARSCATEMQVLDQSTHRAEDLLTGTNVDVTTLTKGVRLWAFNTDPKALGIRGRVHLDVVDCEMDGRIEWSVDCKLASAKETKESGATSGP